MFSAAVAAAVAVTAVAATAPVIGSCFALVKNIEISVVGRSNVKIVEEEEKNVEEEKKKKRSGGGLKEMEMTNGQRNFVKFFVLVCHCMSAAQTVNSLRIKLEKTEDSSCTQEVLAYSREANCIALQ